MNRRGFLGALTGLAAAPLLAQTPLLSSELALVAEPIMLPTLSAFGRIVEISVHGSGDVGRAGGLRLFRLGQQVLNFPVNELGGMAFWRAVPGHEVLFDPRFPVGLDLSEHVAARLVYERGGKLFMVRHDKFSVQADEPLLLPEPIRRLK